jgi:small subunit ribosomal protein S20
VANHKSAEKRNRQRIKRRARNLMHLSKMRTYIKRVRKALDTDDLAAAQEVLPQALTAISKAQNKGVIHHNTAARYTSRLSLAMNRATAQTAS